MPHPRRGVAPAVASSDHYAAICAALWAERKVLESLACASVVGRLMNHSNGLQAWNDDIAQTEDEAEIVERLKLHEVLRAAMVEALLDVTDEPTGTTLEHLATRAPEPWSTMLADHRAALRQLLADVESLSSVYQLSLVEFVA